MAATAITNTALTRGTGAAFPTTAAVAANAGALIPAGYEDSKMLIILENSDTDTTATAKIVKGNGLQGVADLSVSVEPSSTSVVVVESGGFKDVSGDDKGKILVIDNDTTATTLKVACIVLP